MNSPYEDDEPEDDYGDQVDGPMWEEVDYRAEARMWAGEGPLVA